MSKGEFKRRWEGGVEVVWEEIAMCATAWGIAQRPKTRPMNLIRYQVLCAAGCSDAEDYNPDSDDDEFDDDEPSIVEKFKEFMLPKPVDCTFRKD